MLHSIIVLEQGMGLEASLCPVLHNVVVLVWEMGKSDHMDEEVFVAYTAKVDKKDKSQQVVELAYDAWKVFD